MVATGLLSGAVLQRTIPPERLGLLPGPIAAVHDRTDHSEQKSILF